MTRERAQNGVSEAFFMLPLVQVRGLAKLPGSCA